MWSVLDTVKESYMSSTANQINQSDSTSSYFIYRVIQSTLLHQAPCRLPAVVEDTAANAQSARPVPAGSSLRPGSKPSK